MIPSDSGTRSCECVCECVPPPRRGDARTHSLGGTNIDGRNPDAGRTETPKRKGKIIEPKMDRKRDETIEAWVTRLAKTVERQQQQINELIKALGQ